MKQELVLSKLKHLKTDLKKLELFANGFFVFDDCNCSRCCEARNSLKFASLIRSIYFDKGIKLIRNEPNIFANNFILRELSKIINAHKIATSE